MSKNQEYAKILDDADAIKRIRKWVSEHRNGFKSAISANQLGQQLGDPELKRELVVLREIRFDDDTSFSECVLKGIKKKGVRKKLLPALAAKVFGLDPRDVFTRLINFSNLEHALCGASASVESVAKPFSSDESSVEDQTEALFGVVDALFLTLEAMDRERYLILLRIVCVLHLTFTWTAQVDADCEINKEVSRRFFDYLGVPDSERSLSRLKKGVGKIVSRILPGEQPLSVLVPEFEEWWRSLFVEIDMRGIDLLGELTPELSQLPRNPFRLTHNREEMEEQDNVPEEEDVEKEQDASAGDNARDIDGGDSTFEDFDEDRALNDLDCGDTNEKVEPVDPIDRATDEAESLRKAPQREQSKLVRKYFDELAECVSPLEYNHYKDLPVSELRTLLSLAAVVESRISGVRSTLENEISRRESADSDSGEAV